MFLSLVSLAFAGVCSSADLKKGVTALDSLSDKSLRPMLAAAALQEACAFDAGLEKALIDFQGVSPDHLRMIDMMAVGDGRAWTRACPAGPRVLASAVSLVVGEQRGFVWDQCELGKLGVLGDRAAFVRGTGAMILPVVLVGVLGEEKAAAAPLLRALAGE